jgi:foldase protein PrsA
MYSSISNKTNATTYINSSQNEKYGKVVVLHISNFKCMEGEPMQGQNVQGNSVSGWKSWLTVRNAIILFIIIVVVGLVFYFRGTFIAASVNGVPISRFAVISELEKQGGAQTLDSLITKKLIEAEMSKNKVMVADEEINSEITTIEQQITSQGGTLASALQQQGMTRDQLAEQIKVQKQIEKFLADKAVVADAEVDTYIKDNKITPPAGVKIEDLKVQVKTQLQQMKLTQAAQEWISNLKAGANIKYYVKY